jgi:putative GTP pyrophosphokinase
MLVRQDDITLIEEKDYIKNPKENGYRSLHLIVEIPVFFSDHKKMMPVEVQIRTIAMDFWASLEHQVKYKKEVDNEEDIIAELRQCAETIAATDRQMLEIRNKIFGTEDNSLKPMDALARISRAD